MKVHLTVNEWKNAEIQKTESRENSMNIYHGFVYEQMSYI